MLQATANDSLNTPNIVDIKEASFPSFNMISSTNEKSEKIIYNKKSNLEDVTTPNFVIEKKCEANNNKSCDNSQKISTLKIETSPLENVNTVIQTENSL